MLDEVLNIFYHWALLGTYWTILLISSTVFPVFTVRNATNMVVNKMTYKPHFTWTLLFEYRRMP